MEIKFLCGLKNNLNDIPGNSRKTPGSKHIVENIIFSNKFILYTDLKETMY